METYELGRVTASLFKDERATFERIEKFISPHHFIDYNLRGRVYGENAQVTLVHVDCGQERVAFAAAKAKLDAEGNASRSRHRSTCTYTFLPSYRRTAGRRRLRDRPYLVDSLVQSVVSSARLVERQRDMLAMGFGQRSDGLVARRVADSG